MQRRIDYAISDDGRAAPPVLAVKLQELFGLADTPRIADGRVPLTVHLLSPAGRPLQVTRDLRSFWENTYPEVRREMKGRYQKYPWPDDPWNAVATHRAKPRGTGPAGRGHSTSSTPSSRSSPDQGRQACRARVLG